MTSVFGYTKLWSRRLCRYQDSKKGVTIHAMLYWFMGYPGVGKDYCAEKLSQLLGCPYVDADDFLTPAYKKALREGTFTLQNRLEKLSRIRDHIQKLLKTNPDVAAADSLPESVSRQFIYDSFKPDVRFILVQASPGVHKKRLRNRKNHFFTEDLLDNYVKKHWQPITMPHTVLTNDGQHGNDLEQALRLLLT